MCRTSTQHNGNYGGSAAVAFNKLFGASGAAGAEPPRRRASRRGKGRFKDMDQSRDLADLSMAEQHIQQMVTGLGGILTQVDGELTSLAPAFQGNAGKSMQDAGRGLVEQGTKLRTALNKIGELVGEARNRFSTNEQQSQDNVTRLQHNIYDINTTTAPSAAMS
jgi:uncharacterized protein YukE